MKKIFIKTKYTGKPTLLDEELNKLPEKITIVGTIQYKDYFKQIKNKLTELKKQPTIGITKQTTAGQILGCDVHLTEKTKKTFKPDSDCFLYIGDGIFHPIKIAFTYNKPVYMLELRNGEIKKIDQKEVEKYSKRKKGALIKFLSSDKIGVLFTTKPGQNKNEDKTIKKLKTKYPNKTFYPFIAHEINFQSLENFPFIESWINTACPRIEEDFRCINIEDLIND